MRNLIILLSLFGYSLNIPVAIKVEDGAGAPLKEELVIVQDLNDHEREALRVLSDQSGSVPALDLKPGLYRAIATNPYGMWRTEVHEFLLTQSPVKLVLKVEQMGTHGNGDIVTVGVPEAELQVLTQDGQPASGAAVLARDKEATLNLERRYRTDEHGMVRVQLVGSPTVMVVIYQNKLTTKEVLSKPASLVVRVGQD